MIASNVTATCKWNFDKHPGRVFRYLLRQWDGEWSENHFEAVIHNDSKYSIDILYSFPSIVEILSIDRELTENELMPIKYSKYQPPKPCTTGLDSMNCIPYWSGVGCNNPCDVASI